MRLHRKVSRLAIRRQARITPAPPALVSRSLEARKPQGLGAAQQTDRAAHCLSRRRVCAVALRLRFYVASQAIFAAVGAFCPTRFASNGLPDFHTAKAIRNSLRAITTKAT